MVMVHYQMFIDEGQKRLSTMKPVSVRVKVHGRLFWNNGQLGKRLDWN